MDSKYTFEPLGISKTARRSATSFNVTWNGAPGGIPFGVVRRNANGKWVGLYAWRTVSEPMDSKNAVADWMLDVYEGSLSGR